MVVLLYLKCEKKLNISGFFFCLEYIWDKKNDFIYISILNLIVLK